LSQFRVIETNGFLKDLAQDFGGQRQSLLNKLKDFVYPQLGTQPYFGKNIKKLKNYTPDTWRYRIGNFIFFYEIDDEKHLVIMIAADNRRDAYR